MIFDKVETCNADAKHMLKEHFAGNLVNQIKSLDGAKPYTSEREEPFYVLPLDVRGKTSIYESLDAFVQAETLSGDNQYELPSGEKVDAAKRVFIKSLPKHLIVHLKRFEFDFTTMTKKKVNDYCSFPMELDMEPYTQKGVEGDDGDDDSKSSDEDTDCVSSKYALSGVLAHHGTSDSGHYYSFIRERQARFPEVGRQWFEFNDRHVLPYSPERLPVDTFGGKFVAPTRNANGEVVDREYERQNSAYIIVYDRIDSAEEEDAEVDEESRSHSNSISSTTSLTDEPAGIDLYSRFKRPRGISFHHISEEIEQSSTPAMQDAKRQNELFMFEYYILDESYSKYCWNVLNAIDVESMSPWDAVNASRVFISVIFGTVAHASSSAAKVEEWCDKLVETVFSKSIDACEWLLYAASCSPGSDSCMIKSYLIDCSFKKSRQLFSSVLLFAAERCHKSGIAASARLSEDEAKSRRFGVVMPPHYIDSVPESPIIHVIDALSMCLNAASERPSNCSEFSDLFYGLANFGPDYRKHIVNMDCIYMLSDFFLQSQHMYSYSKRNAVTRVKGKKLRSLPKLIVMLMQTCNIVDPATSSSLDIDAVPSDARTISPVALDNAQNQLSETSEKWTLSNGQFLQKLIIDDMEAAGTLFRHCIFDNRARSDVLVRFAVKSIVKHTEVVQVSTMNFVKVMGCILRTSDAFQTDRLKTVLPELVHRTTELFHRKQAGDAYFIHHCTTLLHGLCHRSDTAMRLMLDMRNEWVLWPKSCRYMQPIIINQSHGENGGDNDASAAGCEV